MPQSRNTQPNLPLREHTLYKRLTEQMMQQSDLYSDHFDPGPSELEDQVARNEAYTIELDRAAAGLRSQSSYWSAAAMVFATVGICFVFTVFIQSPFHNMIVDNYLLQALINTISLSTLLVAVACSHNAILLRRLADDAFSISETNVFIIKGARALLDRMI